MNKDHTCRQWKWILWICIFLLGYCISDAPISAMSVTGSKFEHTGSGEHLTLAEMKQAVASACVSAPAWHGPTTGPTAATGKTIPIISEDLRNGCHIRESELLVEIVDPATGRILPDSRMGEVVLTTLGREAMPLIRYRTGDTAALDRSPCPCGGVTARLNLIRGRLAACRLANGGMLFSQDVDDVLFTVPGLLDYRLTIESGKVDSMDVSFVADRQSAETKIRRLLLQIPVIRDNLAEGGIVVGASRRVKGLDASDTVKRTILNKRNSTLKGEPCSTF